MLIKKAEEVVDLLRKAYQDSDVRWKSELIREAGVLAEDLGEDCMAVAD